MQPQIDQLKNHVKGMASQAGFVHHEWFVRWHLELVERLAKELLANHANANSEVVEVMAWMHDYGLMIDASDAAAMTQAAGRERMVEFDFPSEFIAKVIENLDTLDSAVGLESAQTPIEVQIVATADGCAHLVGPYLKLQWLQSQPNITEVTATSTEKADGSMPGVTKASADNTEDNRLAQDVQRIEHDWQRKIVLPEAKLAFQKYYDVSLAQAGKLPERFFN